MSDALNALQDLIDALPVEHWEKVPMGVRNRAMKALYPQASPLGAFVEGYQEALKIRFNIKEGEVV